MVEGFGYVEDADPGPMATAAVGGPLRAQTLIVNTRTGAEPSLRPRWDSLA